MVNNPFSSSRKALSLQRGLEIANLHLDNARKTKDPEIALALCNDAEAALSRMKRAAKKTLKLPLSDEDQALRDRFAGACLEHANLLESFGYIKMAQVSYKRAEKWGYVRLTKDPGPVISSATDSACCDMARVPEDIFPDDMRQPTVKYALPDADERLSSTSQLAYCLGLLQVTPSPEEVFEPAARNWVESTEKNTEEKERLRTLATDVIRAFTRDELKDAKAVAEVVCLGPVLEKDDFQHLLMLFVSGSGIEHSGLLDIHSLKGLAQLVQSAPVGCLGADDLVTILRNLKTRLQDTHNQSPAHIYQLTLVVSNVLDAMTDTHVSGLQRVELHEPLSAYLNELQTNSDPYLIYQAAYAFQALQYVPDNDSPWQATKRLTRVALKGVSETFNAAKDPNVNGFIRGLRRLQEGLGEVIQVAKIGYEGVSALAESGQGLLESLKDGLSFNQKRVWYVALRVADTLLRDGQLAKFKTLVCEAPCRRDLVFQLGVCQRLRDLAANSLWDIKSRQGAVAFLGEMYRNDAEWGQQALVKQCILHILIQLTSTFGSAMPGVESLLQELESNGDEAKRILYQAFRKENRSLHPLQVALPIIASPSLLDLVQNKPDIEADLRRLRKQRLNERGEAVYIPPQAKANLQAPDDKLFDLKKEVEGFLSSDRKVMLLLGDSGAGKSTFNRQLECDLWDVYKKKEGRIPLFISLHTIDKPEQDLIAKHLRKAEFTESQIRELKVYRKFVLICDGYDESQQTHNLYMSNRLNLPGEWSAQMVISCRSEYLGLDYQNRFQPADRNHQTEPAFQEAVIAPFSMDQIQEYIGKYVSVTRPLWQVTDYLKALDLIPSLLVLAKSPFLLILFLEVLPRMVDPGQNLATAKITRVALYDQFVEQWLERGKKRLSAKDMSSQEKKAFESLSNEGFTQKGIVFLKGMAVAIYEEQAGNPVVDFSRTQDQGTWKASFFNRNEEKQLLREACPLIRSGNQFRFIHRSLLEYSLARAVFEPQEGEKNTRKTTAPTSEARRCSVGSAFSFELQGALGQKSAIVEQGPDIDSPLVRRNYVSEPSILEFLEERVQQEPVFKQQLLAFIEHSKTDRKWRVAAANAITILVRAGFQFNGADLQGIQIPGADLSHGVFDSAQLQGADLRKVNLRNVWFRQANLSDAQMTDVQFDELPYLEGDGEILSCAYSPDGNTYAVGQKDGQINVYSTTTWEKTRTLVCHGGGFGTIVYSPKGDLIVAVDNYRDLRLWEVETGACCHVLSGHSEWIVSVAYSPSGGQIASGSNDKTVRLWDVETGKCCHILSGHEESLWNIAYSPKGDLIASGSRDKTVRLWDVETGDCRHVLRGHSERILSVAYSPSGDQIASGSVDATVRLWDVETGVCQHILSGHSGTVQSVMYSPNGGQIASVSDDKTVRLWDVQTGEFHQTLSDNGSKVQSIAYSPAGDQIASGSDDSTLQLWDVATGVCRRSLRVHSGPIQSVVFSPKGNQIACGGDDGKVWLGGFESGTGLNYSSGQTEQVLSVVCSRDNVASASLDRAIRLWDMQAGECRHILNGHKDLIKTVVYSPTGDQVASGSYDTTVRLWDFETGDCRHILSGHGGWIYDLAYSPKGDLIASASNGGIIRLWDAVSGDCRQTLHGHDGAIFSISYSPKGNKIASCGHDKVVRLWDVESGDCRHTLTDHSDWVLSVAFSPIGDQIASGSKDNTVRLWDVETGKCRHILSGHEDSIWDFAYSPEGNRIVSASDDNTVRLWDTESGACVHTMLGHRGRVRRVAYSPKDDMIASASGDRTVRLWDAKSGQCYVVLPESHGSVYSIAWSASYYDTYLVTGCDNSSVRAWRIIRDGDQCRVLLHWSSSHDRLTMTDASLQGVRGLSQPNKQLLKQHGTEGEPSSPITFQMASKELYSMASVASKPKPSLHNRTMDTSPAAIASVVQPAMPVESTNPSELA